MKKMTFAALALCLLAAGVAPQQPESRRHPERVAKGETVTNSDAETEVGKALPIFDPNPSDLSDGDAIRLSRSFFGTPWETPESREGLVLSVDTAEGQLYLGCLYARSPVLSLRPGTVGGSRAAAKVVECCRKALALKPGYAEAYIVMAEGLWILDRYKDAEAALESAIALRPDWASAYCPLADVLVAQERYSDALAASQEEVRLSQQAAISGMGSGYRGPWYLHSYKNDTLRLDHIQFKIEHPNDVWLPNERIRALHLNHDRIGWLNPDNDNK